jgi:NADPH:quinone reductase-like Zn-dependent oxidoreductase
VRAIVANRLGDPEVLEEAALVDPVPGPGEVLVELRAASVNRRDRGVRLGTIRPQDRGEGEGSVAPFPYVLGSDGSGVVVERGTGVDAPLEGAEVVINPALFWGPSELAPASTWQVLGVPRQGTYAERIAVPADYVLPKPARLTWRQAAALPLAGLTAWRALVTRARVEHGERVLVPGCGSGVATYLIQFARDLGAEVVVSSSSPAKLARARELGASSGVLYTDEDWARQVGEVDVIVDSAGAPIWQSLNGLLRHGGRLVSFGRTAGGTAEVNIGSFFHAQWSFLGTANGSPREFDHMLAHVEGADWMPEIDSVYPLARAAEAHARLDDPARFGKIVLDIA